MKNYRRLTLTLISLLITLTAFGCVPADDEPSEPLRTGRTQVCIRAPSDTADTMPGDINDTLQGTIVGEVPAEQVSDSLSCNATRALEVDVDGESWFIGYSVLDHQGNDVTPVVGFAPGESVQMSIARQQGWGVYYAFAVESKEDPLLAINDGMGAILPAGALDGMTVEEGSSYGARRPDSCGTKVGHTLLFDAATTSELRSGYSGTVELGTGPVDITSISAWNYDKVQCTDTWGPNAWMAVRMPAQ